MGFPLMFKTAVLQDIISPSMALDLNVTIINFFILLLIPSVETQLMFNEATQNNYKTSYDEYYAGRRLISDMNVQKDIGLAQQVSSPEYLICAHQTPTRADTPKKYWYSNTW